MNHKIVILIARQFWKNTFQSKAIYGILFVIALMVGYAGYTGWKTFVGQNEIREHYQRIVRKSWEDNPDKHPHRMAHFGSFAFRKKHPLSAFDFGLESFIGNAVYLEAHKQNTVNFSEASFSTGLLRFGEISLAMVLQIILPLVVVFLGFSAVSQDRENETLKIILTQGAGWKEILAGKTIGLLLFPLLIMIPVFLMILILLSVSGKVSVDSDLLTRYAATIVVYFTFILVVCIATIIVSATSSSSKSSLLKLLGLWLVLAIVLPRTTQALGSYFLPAPSKVEFETAIEEHVMKEGDSHNPDDPHYKHLRDSVLQVHNVDSVHKLPFNYSGFVMREGEKISANIYKQHLKELTEIYDKQNSLTRIIALINPFGAVRNLSMALTGTDFQAYKVFQDEAEKYRYQLAQKMNELQIEFISNVPAPNDKPHGIDRNHWKEIPDFAPQRIAIASSVKHEAWSVIALLCWLTISIWMVKRISKTLKAI
jgi:ABC-2 type transport system permease protein